MKKLLKISVLTALLFVTMNGIAQNLNDQQKTVVSKFIEHVKNRDWESLSASVSYPIRRIYPVPAIENEAEFIERRSELIDDKLITKISSSSPANDWSEVGWRGIMLENGVIWLDDEGNLVAVNYQSEIEKLKETELIEADRDTLPVSIQVYERPVLQMNTEKFFVRIDQLEDESYRFAGWVHGSRNVDGEPVELIYNGILEYHGSGGNHTYTFESDFGKFVCYINVMREEDGSPGELVIYRDDKVFREYPADWLKN